MAIEAQLYILLLLLLLHLMQFVLKFFVLKFQLVRVGLVLFEVFGAFDHFGHLVLLDLQLSVAFMHESLTLHHLPLHSVGLGHVGFVLVGDLLQIVVEDVDL